MRIDRKEFIEELILREHISRAIRIVQEKRRKERGIKLAEERELRKIIRSLLIEADADKAPHKSTGINVLEDLLKKIIPVIEQDYKQLTTDPQQRESFRAHVVNAVQNTIAPVATADDAEGGEEASAPGDEYEVMGLEEIEVVTGDDAEELEGEEGEGDEAPADDAFIDIDGPAAEEEEDTFGLEGEDQTGRNFAQATFDKIEKQIVDSYGLLAADEDKELFYDYLITNLKLYFDKFEDELSSVLPEPTTPEYEDEKDSQDAEGEDELGGEEGDELDMGGEEEGEEELEL